MLTITDGATTLLKEVRRQAGAPDEAGARIHSAVGPDGQTPTINLALVDAPEETDVVVGEPDMQIFVAEELVPHLEDRTLDVQVTDQGPALVLK